MGIHTSTKEKWYRDYLYQHNRLNSERIPLKKTVFFKLVELEEEIRILVNKIESKDQRLDFLIMLRSEIQGHINVIENIYQVRHHKNGRETHGNKDRVD